MTLSVRRAGRGEGVDLRFHLGTGTAIPERGCRQRIVNAFSFS